MPTVPEFGFDNDQKIGWLRKYYVSHNHFESTVGDWDGSEQICNSIVKGAGIIGTALLTILTTLQSSIFFADTNNTSATKIFSFVQTGIGIATVLLTAVTEVTRRQYASARDNARRQFDPAFFSAVKPETIWEPGNNYEDVRVNKCRRWCFNC